MASHFVVREPASCVTHGKPIARRTAVLTGALFFPVTITSVGLDEGEFNEANSIRKTMDDGRRKVAKEFFIAGDLNVRLTHEDCDWERIASTGTGISEEDAGEERSTKRIARINYGGCR